MANAVFNSYEDYLSKDTSNPVQHNSFDLSHIRNFTTTYGALIPFYLEDCVPSDHFKISNVVKVQSLPMANPLFNNIKVQTWYFYVPYYLLWRKFDLFISGGRDGTYSAEFPVTQVGFTFNSLADYFGLPIPSGIDPARQITVSAFPFAAYQLVYRDYFMNQDLQTTSNTNNWFPADDDEFSLHDGLNYWLNKSNTLTDSDGVTYLRGSCTPVRGLTIADIVYPSNWNSTIQGNSNSVLTSSASKEPWLELIRFKNFKRDYFTSAMFSPQRGPAMGLSSTNVSPFTASDFTSIVTGTSLPYAERLGLSWSNSDQSDIVFAPFRDDLSLGDAHVTTVLSKLGNIISNKVSSAITISDIMTASQVQLWMERNMQVKAQYNEFLRVHFGDAPLDERLTKPYYIGGTSQYINVSAVVQTSESGTTPQGTMTGLGSTQDSQFVGSFTSHEYGLILGIMCIMPDVYYVQGLERVWSHKTKFDFYFPEFAQLPPEPILNKEIWFNNASNNNNDGVFGYAGRYDFMRHRRSMSVGDLRSPQMRDFNSWVINRSFSSLPTLNSWDFISTLKGYGGFPTIPARRYKGVQSDVEQYVELNNVPMDHFPTGNAQNPFIVQVGLNINASRPLPFRNEPQTLNLRRG